MSKTSRSVVTLAGVLWGVGAGVAGAQAAGSHVVELFTAQGCSSCPPADTLLGEIAALPNVVALAFHVDYWDSLGLRDRFELPLSSARQSRYVDGLRLSTAFTPQVIIDGRSSYLGSDRQRILKSLAVAADPVAITLAVQSGDLIVTLPEKAVHLPYDVNVIAYLPQASTAIGRGENAGRTLAEFNIVRQFRRIAGWTGQSSVLRVPLSSFPQDANRVAVLLQQTGQGGIDGSAVTALRE